MTPSDLITRALRLITVLAEGEVPTAQQSSDAFDSVNALIDQWASERLELYQVTNTIFTITPNVQTYLVGTGQAVNVVRPVFIDHVNFINSSSSPPLELQLNPLTDDAWSKVPVKLLTSPFPTSWYYNATYPNGTLMLWPIPTATTLTGSVYSPVAVPEFTSLTQTVTFPPAYRRMIVTNLAVELMPEYGINPGSVQGLIQQAAESKAAVKRANLELMDMSCDAAALIQGQSRRYYYNIYAGP